MRVSDHPPRREAVTSTAFAKIGRLVLVGARMTTDGRAPSAAVERRVCAHRRGWRALEARKRQRDGDCDHDD